MSTHHLSIMEQVSPEPNPDNRFRIVELVMTVDGPRSRLTNHSFPSIEAARHFLKETGQ